MSYATKKGYDGEVELAEFLTDIFSQQGFEWFRVGGVERNKQTLAGDVCLKDSTDPDRECVLRDYLFDAKKQAQPHIWNALEKAEDDAETWGRWGAILYIIKQAKGSRGDRLVAMRPETFERLIRELQGWRSQEEENEN